MCHIIISTHTLRTRNCSMVASKSATTTGWTCDAARVVASAASSKRSRARPGASWSEKTPGAALSWK